MKVSTKGKYALLIMIELAKNVEQTCSITDLAKTTGISNKYLEKIISLLVKENLVKAFRGANGGYQLANFADQITLGQVMRATEGSLITVECVNNNEVVCDMQDSCLSVSVWLGLDRAINKYFDSITLDDVINKRVLSKKL